ncbi:MAG: hypothetical protein M1836_005471 [Candelina mexicana]|nr:MAG: hypothetical protein M1836_005471 [Candelina mexicana]
MPRVFLITGTSSGFGQNLVQEVLDRGDTAIATARNPSSLTFTGTTTNNYLPLPLDVTKAESIKAAFSRALKTFGRIDVVINNAGTGLTGPFEESTDAQIRTQFEINFFGVLAVTREAMQVMRQQRPSGGLVQQVSSIGAQIGFPWASAYSASKWAVEGFTESVAQEANPEWGIKFTCVEPGVFNTNWAQNLTFTERNLPAYAHLDLEGHVKTLLGAGKGDPRKAARAMYALAILEDPPLRVAIGTDAYEWVYQKIRSYEENHKKYEEISKSTDADEQSGQTL